MSLLNTLPTRITDGAGRPIAFGRAFFYLASTSDMVEVFADAELTIPRTNPVIAGGPEDPGMLPPIFVDDSAAVRVVYTDEADVPIYEADDVAGLSAPRSVVDTVNALNYSYVAGDGGRTKRRTFASPMADLLPTAAAVGNGWFTDVINAASTQALTISVTGGGTIDGAASLTLQAGQRTRIKSMGSQFTADPLPISTGKHLISLPAGAWVPRNSNGAEYEEHNYAVNNIRVARWKFDAATEEAVDTRFRLPQSYDSQPIDFSVCWGAEGATPGQTASWGIRARVLGDGDAIDQSWGVGGVVADALSGPNTSMLTAYGTFTPAAPAGDLGGRLLALELYRVIGGTVAGDAYVDEVAIKVGIIKSNDA